MKNIFTYMLHDEDFNKKTLVLLIIFWLQTFLAPASVSDIKAGGSIPAAIVSAVISYLVIGYYITSVRSLLDFEGKGNKYIPEFSFFKTLFAGFKFSMAFLLPFIPISILLFIVSFLMITSGGGIKLVYVVAYTSVALLFVLLLNTPACILAFAKSDSLAFLFDLKNLFSVFDNLKKYSISFGLWVGFFVGMIPFNFLLRYTSSINLFLSFILAFFPAVIHAYLFYVLCASIANVELDKE